MNDNNGDAVGVGGRQEAIRRNTAARREDGSGEGWQEATLDKNKRQCQTRGDGKGEAIDTINIRQERRVSDGKGF